MKRKRAPITSPEAAVQAAVNAAKGPPRWPAHVTIGPGAEPFWDAIVSARPYDEWAPADLVVAAQLARTQHDIERESRSLEAEGSIVENARGTRLMNPRVTVLQQLAQREMALMRTLRMGGRVTGDGEADAARGLVQRRAAKLRAELRDDDELLA